MFKAVFNKSTASDPTYHSRHGKRTLARAQRIAENIETPGQLLDVGCNNGITSAFMLDNGKAEHVTGIELHADTVEESLRKREDFTLIEGNVVELELDRTWDHIIYGAVHHHILNLFGLSAAIENLQDLAGRCRKSLFFETGQITEGARWNWQVPMRKHFRTDEEHFFYLVRSIEHLITGFEVIGEFWIHGIRRYYLRFDMRQDAEAPAGAFGAWPETTSGPLARTFGSREQKLVPATDAVAADSPTRFWIAGEPGEQLFVKEHAHLPVAANAEWAIGNQLHEDWAVRPVARVGERGALAFPYLQDAVKVTSMRGAPESERRALAAAVVEVLRDAEETHVTLPEGLLLSPGKAMRLVDVIDLNANNLLVVPEGAADVLKVIDFEPQSNAYHPRNRLHIAGVLWSLKQRRLFAVSLYVRGWLGIVANLVRHQFVSFEERISRRQPGLVSLLVADARNVLGKITGRLLRAVGLD